MLLLWNPLYALAKIPWLNFWIKFAPLCLCVWQEARTKWKNKWRSSKDHLTSPWSVLHAGQGFNVSFYPNSSSQSQMIKHGHCSISHYHLFGLQTPAITPFKNSSNVTFKTNCFHVWKIVLQATFFWTWYLKQYIFTSCIWYKTWYNFIVECCLLNAST